VSDDYRVRVQLAPEHIDPLLASLAAHQGDDIPRTAVSVDRDEHEVFIYADTADTAEHARAAVQSALDENAAQGEVTVSRWHPVAERWEDPSEPVPASDASSPQEHAERMAEEDEESREEGFPEWEVRITLPSHHAARAYAKQLQADGIPVVRRWKHLLVGADDEDIAKALVERLKAEAPHGSELVVEGNSEEAYRAYAKRESRYSYFGGLGQ